MNIVKVASYVFILITVSYSSLWYGFIKGYEYNNSHKLADAVFKTAELKAVRSGEIEKAIDLLEQSLNTNIIEYRYSDKDFIKYIIGLPKPEKETHEKLIQQIRKYRESTSYKCESDKQVCDAISEVLNGYNATFNKSLQPTAESGG